MKMVIRNGQATMVYSDLWRPILEAIGAIDAPKVTDIEWESGAFVARLRETGEEIARGANRADVIRREVEYLEARL